jgi:hypothetical protein
MEGLGQALMKVLGVDSSWQMERKGGCVKATQSMPELGVFSFRRRGGQNVPGLLSLLQPHQET